jgi:biotin carboxylase
VADTADAAGKLLAERSGRWIVKPRDAFGSEGVALVTAPSGDGRGAAECALAFSDAVIVEEFVTGDEYSAEGIVVGGEPHVLALTRKETTDPPYFVELGHVQPAGLAPGVEAKTGSTRSPSTRGRVSSCSEPCSTTCSAGR